jgi:UDP-3-O-acyl-N-acetylglucosamine deacetylase
MKHIRNERASIDTPLSVKLAMVRHLLMPKQGCQKTLNRSFTCTGVGVHTGAFVTMEVQPAPPHHGIMFSRTDMKDSSQMIPALWHAVINTSMCTQVQSSISWPHSMAVALIMHL